MAWMLNPNETSIQKVNDESVSEFKSIGYREVLVVEKTLTDQQSVTVVEEHPYQSKSIDDVALVSFPGNTTKPYSIFRDRTGRDIELFILAIQAAEDFWAEKESDETERKEDAMLDFLQRNGQVASNLSQGWAELARRAIAEGWEPPAK